MEEGEWLQYTLNVKQKGTYTIQLTVASNKDSAQLSVSVAGTKINTDVAVPNTGGVNKWQVVELTGVSLSSGKQIVRIHVLKSECNLKSIRFTAEASKKR